MDWGIAWTRTVAPARLVPRTHSVRPCRTPPKSSSRNQSLAPLLRSSRRWSSLLITIAYRRRPQRMPSMKREYSVLIPTSPKSSPNVWKIYDSFFILISWIDCLLWYMYNANRWRKVDNEIEFHPNFLSYQRNLMIILSAS